MLKREKFRAIILNKIIYSLFSFINIIIIIFITLLYYINYKLDIALIVFLKQQKEILLLKQSLSVFLNSFLFIWIKLTRVKTRT